MQKHSFLIQLVCAVAAVVLVAGCAGDAGKDSAVSGSSSAPAPSNASLDRIIVKSAPTNTIAVMAAKKDAKDGDSVVVAGRVKDFVEGAPVFTLADESLKACTPDECKTPSDYCCETPDRIAQGLTTVRLVGDDGKPLAGEIKGVNSLDSLVHVAVEGKAQRDKAGNLSIQATKVYVQDEAASPPAGV